MRPSLLAKLQRRQRRINLLPPAIARELRELPALLTTTPAEPGSALKLIGRREVRSNNSWMHNSERLVSGKQRCTLLMHPTDALLRGLHDGDLVSVSSRVGAVQVPLQLSEDLRPGVVSLPHGWGHGRDGVQLRVAQAHAGASINDLTDDRLTERIAANAAFSAVPVWVQRAA